MSEIFLERGKNKPWKNCKRTKSGSVYHFSWARLITALQKYQQLPSVYGLDKIDRILCNDSGVTFYER